jgi:hypothetical protein
MFERADRAPTLQLAKAVEEALGLEPGRLTELLPVGRRETVFKALGPWLDIEAGARELWTWEPTIVPGLLQTPEYARAIVDGKPGISAEEIETAVRDRMARKQIFERSSPPRLYAVLDESILYRPIGSEGVTRDQLAYLIEVAPRPYNDSDPPAQCTGHRRTSGRISDRSYGWACCCLRRFAG